MVNEEIRHQIDVMRAQKNIELNGPIEEVNNYIQALSRIYELAGDETESNMLTRDLMPEEKMLISTLDSLPGKENQNLRALVAQDYIQQFGPVKDDIGDYVKKLLAGD